MRTRLLAVAAALLTTMACLDTLEPPDGRLGVVILETYESGPDYVLKPVATFYDQVNQSFGVTPIDTCFVSSNVGTVTFGNPKTMDVGEEISMIFPDRIEALGQVMFGSILTYQSTLATGIEFTPGDSLEVQIPGNGGSYPPVNLKVRTAEAFTHADVPVPAEGVDVDLTWDAATEPGALMSFELFYVTAGSQTGLFDQKVYCGLADDGAHTIPAGLLAGWRTSQSDFRETVVTRLRYADLAVDTRSTLAMFSTFVRPTPSPP